MNRNGVPSAAFLRKPLSKGYVPRVFGFTLDVNDPRPWFRLSDVERQRRDPKIRLGLRTLRAPIRRATWKVKANSDAVRQFVDGQLKRIWKRCLGRLLKMLEYGYCAGEWDYRTEDNLIVVRDLIDFYAFDCDPLVLHSEIVGLLLRNQAREIRIGAPRFLWLVNEPEYDKYRGMSRLANAWTPWQEKTGRHGALESRRLWFLKNAYNGRSIRYPDGFTVVDDGNGNLTSVNNQDLAREIAEKMENGGIIALPNDRDDKGEYKWQIEAPTINDNASEIREYPKDLDIEQLEGLGIPPEVIQTTGDAGSGYAGRSIPAQAFYSSEDDIVITVIDGVDRSCLWHMVRANYGSSARYEIEVDSLLPKETSSPAPAPGQSPFGREPSPMQVDDGDTDPLLQDPPNQMRLSLATKVYDQARRMFPDVLQLALPADASTIIPPTSASSAETTPAAAAEPHKFASTQVALPIDLADAVRAFARDIPADEINADGIEDDPHVTILYGLNGDEPAAVQAAVQDFGPVSITLGPLSIFANADADVLKVEVIGPALHRLNKRISARCENTQTHPEYLPHVTIAYLNPGEGRKFVGDTSLAGRTFKFDRFVFSDREGVKTEISLTAEPQSVEMSASAKGDGGRITIGGAKGEDGKRHGGSPVFVKNGVITKGHPGLTGKKISNLKGEADDGSNRTQLSRSREHAKAKLLKEARKEGIDPKHVADLANQMRAHHAEYTNDHNEMLKAARKSLDNYGGGHRAMYAAGKRGGAGQMEDADSIPGLDVVAREIAGQYPGMFGNNMGYDSASYDNPGEDDAAQILFEYLKAGNREHMTDLEAHEAALDHLRDHIANGGTFGDVSDDTSDLEAELRGEAPTRERQPGDEDEELTPSDAEDDFDFPAPEKSDANTATKTTADSSSTSTVNEVKGAKQDNEATARHLTNQIREANQVTEANGGEPTVDPANDPQLVAARKADDAAHAVRLAAATKADDLKGKLNDVDSRIAELQGQQSSRSEDESKPGDATPRRDLFGSVIPKEFTSGPAVSQTQMFPGDPALGQTAGWMDAAKDLAEEMGRPVEKIEAGKRAKIGGQWYSVQRHGDDWKLVPEQGQSADPPAAVKSPWEMTKREGAIRQHDVESSIPWSQREAELRKAGGTDDDVNQALEPYASTHRMQVKYALREGKPVSQEVLNDYPDLTDTSLPSGPQIPAENPVSAGIDEIADVTTSDNQRAAQAKRQKILDSEYAFARASAIGNVGEDLKGSARHRANEWRGLEHAETNGTAEQLVSRDNLLRSEPHNLSATISNTNALPHLAAHLALNLFPPNPGTYSTRVTSPKSPAELRAQYYDAFREIKEAAQAAAVASTDPKDVIAAIRKKTGELINKYRDSKPNDYGVSVQTDAFNPVANALVGLHRKTSSFRPNKTDILGRVNEFVGNVQKKYGSTPSVEMLDKIKDHVVDVMEGDSFNKTFGLDGKTVKRFDPTEAYVDHAERKGGRAIDAKTVEAAQRHMTNNVGLRGLQWGNYVSDDEREHHLTKSAEAFADLADAIGLPDSAISLGGKLGLAIGARGKAGARAHYEPDTQVINLTRSKGVGSLAHEWGHALDHYLDDFGKGFYSARYRPEGDAGQAMGEVRKALHSSGFYTRMVGAVRDAISKGLLPKNASSYWASNEEMFARVFERHVQDKLHGQDRENTYLTGLRKVTHPFWPTKEESAAIAPAMERLLAAVREKFGHKAT